MTIMEIDGDEVETNIKQRLQKNTILWNRLLSTVESEVLDMFEKKSLIDTTETPPKQPEEVEITNMLISEYMDWMGYKMTNSIFMKESGTKLKTSNWRKQMTSSLDLEDNNETSQLPLLSVLISMFKNKHGHNEQSSTY